MRMMHDNSLLVGTSSAPNDGKLSCGELMLGVWRVVVVKDSHFPMFSFQWETLSMSFALFFHILYDMYTISPRFFALCIIAHMWFAIEGPHSLYFSTRLFFFVSMVLPPISALTVLLDCEMVVVSPSWGSLVSINVLSIFRWQTTNRRCICLAYQVRIPQSVFSPVMQGLLIAKASDVVWINLSQVGLQS